MGPWDCLEVPGERAGGTAVLLPSATRLTQCPTGTEKLLPPHWERGPWPPSPPAVETEQKGEQGQMGMLRSLPTGRSCHTLSLCTLEPSSMTSAALSVIWECVEEYALK